MRLGTMLRCASLSVLNLRHLLPVRAEILDHHRLGYNVYQGALCGRSLPSGWRMTLVDMRSVPSALHAAAGRRTKAESQPRTELSELYP